MLGEGGGEGHEKRPRCFQRGHQGSSEIRRGGLNFLHFLQKLVDFTAQGFGLLGQLACGFQHLSGGLTGFVGGGSHLRDGAGHFLGSGGGLLNVAADLGGGRALFLDGRGDACRNLVDLLDGGADAVPMPLMAPTASPVAL